MKIIILVFVILNICFINVKKISNELDLDESVVICLELNKHLLIENKQNIDCLNLKELLNNKSKLDTSNLKENFKQIINRKERLTSKSNVSSQTIRVDDISNARKKAEKTRNKALNVKSFDDLNISIDSFTKGSQNDLGRQANNQNRHVNKLITEAVLSDDFHRDNRLINTKFNKFSKRKPSLTLQISDILLDMQVEPNIKPGQVREKIKKSLNDSSRDLKLINKIVNKPLKFGSIEELENYLTKMK